MCATAFCRQVAKVQSAAIRNGLIYLVVGGRRTAIYADDGVHVDEVVMNTLNAISFGVRPRSSRSCGFHNYLYKEPYFVTYRPPFAMPT